MPLCLEQRTPRVRRRLLRLGLSLRLELLVLGERAPKLGARVRVRLVRPVLCEVAGVFRRGSRVGRDLRRRSQDQREEGGARRTRMEAYDDVVLLELAWVCDHSERKSVKCSERRARREKKGLTVCPTRSVVGGDLEEALCRLALGFALPLLQHSAGGATDGGQLPTRLESLRKTSDSHRAHHTISKEDKTTASGHA